MTPRIQESTSLTIPSLLQRIQLKSGQMGEMPKARYWGVRAGTELPSPHWEDQPPNTLLFSPTWKLPGLHNEGISSHQHDWSNHWPSMIKSICRPSSPAGFTVGLKVRSFWSRLGLSSERPHPEALERPSKGHLITQEVPSGLFIGQNSSVCVFP